MTVSERGTGQGSAISPLLANIYLHYVFDLWANRWRQREATGDMIILRYADDIVVGFEHETDAHRFLDMMRARLEEFALTLHPEKTRLIEFGRMHQPIPRQGEWLRQVVTGYFAYHAVPTNIRALQTFRDCVLKLWRRALRRRGQRDRTTWHRTRRLADDYLPKPRILHPWPERRFAVKHPRWEPYYAGMPLVRFCAGGAQ